MKVKIKDTGKIIEVTECFSGGYSDKNGLPTKVLKLKKLEKETYHPPRIRRNAEEI